jgi:anti-anti-sigma factor
MQHEAVFAMEETRDGLWTRLALSGELDLASAGWVRSRLDELRTARLPVRLDFSNLEFMDSYAARAVCDALAAARRTSWQVELDPSMPRQVKRLMALVSVSRWR